MTFREICDGRLQLVVDLMQGHAAGQSQFVDLGLATFLMETALPQLQHEPLDAA
jgi:hypothetical protein